MNLLLRPRKDMVITTLVPLKYQLYLTMLSDITSFEEGDIKHAICSNTVEGLRDNFHEWEHIDERRDLFQKSLNELVEEGLIIVEEDEDGDEIIYVGEYRGRKVFTYEVENSLSDQAVEVIELALTKYRKSKSAVSRSRGGFLKSSFEDLMQKGIGKMGAHDFTELHGILYELYTGGEIYQLRNKVEAFQTNNILKAYDKFTTFAIITEAVLNYDTYRSKSVPTLINVGYMKDDVFRKLTNPTAGSKDYMRELEDDDGGF